MKIERISEEHPYDDSGEDWDNKVHEIVLPLRGGRHGDFEVGNR